MFRHSISVVLPAHNEEAVVEETVRRCLETLAVVTTDYEVILVDDGSIDLTGAIADAIAATDAHLKVVHNRPNRGYGGALKAGFDMASKDYTFFMDSDGQFDIMEITRLLPLVDRGYRAALGYRSPRRDPFMRLANAWGWKLLISALFGLRVRDIDCAFKLYDSSVLRAMEIVAEGATINAEMLIKLQRMGVRYAEARVTHYPRQHGSASGASVKVILRAFRELLHLRGRLRTWSATAPLPRTTIGAPTPAEELAVGVS
jgi:glycosyltransferase involved in cell wall biosynthesis